MPKQNSPSNQKRLLTTHSLLDSWNYLYKANDDWYNVAYDNFIQTLNRISIEPTKAMLAGHEFERLVSDIVNDKFVDPAHSWVTGATEIAGVINQTGHWEQLR